jgi:hypothetical protein
LSGSSNYGNFLLKIATPSMRTLSNGDRRLIAVFRPTYKELAPKRQLGQDGLSLESVAVPFALFVTWLRLA